MTITQWAGCALTALAADAVMPAAAHPQGRDAGTAEVRTAVRAWRERREGDLVRRLATLVAMPNVSSDRAAVRRTADTLVALLRRHGFAARLLEAEPSAPAVYAEFLAPGARRTIVFYAHYDGQPVDPAQWATPPFEPVLRSRSLAEGGTVLPWPEPGARVDPEARLYGRSAGDDKAPIVALLAAVEALRAARVPLSVNLKVFLEGEEEAGSPNLGAMLSAHRDLLASDAWLFADGPVHQSRRLQVVFGARGVMGAGLTVYGPVRALHSGHYGNWALNPAALLVDLLASMRARDGRITIEGYQDDVRPLTAGDLAALAAIPPVEDGLLREFGLPRSEVPGARLLERTSAPGLNVDGLVAARVGAGSANAIPAEATASLDFRLVPAQTPARVRELVEAHIRRQGFTIVREPPDSTTRRAATGPLVQVVWGQGYTASRTDLDLPVSRAILRIVEELTGAPPVRTPLLGGSLPLYHFAEVLGAPFIILPIANHDNNQHAANENLRIQNLWDGIELFAAVLARLGTEWRAVL